MARGGEHHGHIAQGSRRSTAGGQSGFLAQVDGVRRTHVRRQPPDAAGVDRRYLHGGHRRAQIAGNRRKRQAHSGAVQKRQPQVPRRGYRGRLRRGRKIGGGNFQIIAGPCSWNPWNRSPMWQSASRRRARAFCAAAPSSRAHRPTPSRACTPRALTCSWRPSAKRACPSSPRSWTWPRCPLFEDVDVIQVGARNMQNFELLKELGHDEKSPSS